jgi:hypothetical protein
LFVAGLGFIAGAAIHDAGYLKPAHSLRTPITGGSSAAPAGVLI